MTQQKMSAFFSRPRDIEEAEAVEAAGAVLAARAEEPPAELPMPPATKKKKVESVAPPPLANTTFSCTYGNAHELAGALVRGSSLKTNMSIDFLPDGLRMRQRDSTKTAFIEVNVPKHCWLAYAVPPQGVSCTFFLEQMQGLAKMCKASHSLTFYATTPNTHVVSARIFSSECDKRLRLDPVDADANELLESYDCDLSRYPCQVRLSASTFKEEIDACDKSKATAVQFLVVPEEKRLLFVVHAGRQGARSYESSVIPELFLREPKDEGDVGQHFSATFLSVFATVGLSAATVDLFFGLPDEPLRLLFRLASSPDATITALLGEKVVV